MSVKSPGGFVPVDADAVDVVELEVEDVVLVDVEVEAEGVVDDVLTLTLVLVLMMLEVVEEVLVAGPSPEGRTTNVTLMHSLFTSTTAEVYQPGTAAMAQRITHSHCPAGNTGIHDHRQRRGARKSNLRLAGFARSRTAVRSGSRSDCRGCTRTWARRWRGDHHAPS